MKKRQDRCFVGQEGHLFMDFYDRMSPWTRALLSHAKYNICAACFQKELNRGNMPLDTLKYFEERIRCEEVEAA